ncbi:hypothetical protein SSP531S_36630 [Streptomyces spongiicola]|uniref:Uncharacterized protein n=1 Tax=Streptomyces spongiicola TaxID=1690221 RepID=A0A388T0Y2_9ACTN|nr:hypothetical protein SSP531S_36630 [Streptomyces spongiicola]
MRSDPVERPAVVRPALHEPALHEPAPVCRDTPGYAEPLPDRVMRSGSSGPAPHPGRTACRYRTAPGTDTGTDDAQADTDAGTRADTDGRATDAHTDADTGGRRRRRAAASPSLPSEPCTRGRTCVGRHINSV